MNGIVILGCEASFRSGSPHIFSATLLHMTLIVFTHMWLRPINTTARGQTPGDDERALFFYHRLNECISSFKLILPIRLLILVYQKKETQVKAMCLLKDYWKYILYIQYWIIFTSVHLKGCSFTNYCEGNMSDVYSWENQSKSDKLV